MKKLLTILMILMSAVILLSSCKGENGEVTTEAPGSSEVTEPAADDLAIITGGTTEYKLIRPETASTSLTNAFVALRNTINDKYGVKIDLKDDFVMPGAQPAEYEIIIGHTEREESAAAISDIGYNDSIITVIGKKLIISGGNEEAVVRAVEIFIEKYLIGSELKVSSTLCDVTRAEYPKANLTISGVPISDYVIVYGSNYSSMAKEIAHRLGKLTGTIFEVHSEKEEVAEHEISIGASSRFTDKTNYKSSDDFGIFTNATGGHIFINAANKTAVSMACAELCDILTDNDKSEFALSDLEMKYELPASRDYVNDIESLPLHWALDFKTPEWMLDYDEKYAASMNPSGRLMSCAHRGDMVYYPENSIEGIISAIMMGCDMVEIDPRLTKDGVFILLHDATLTRTTNVEEMAGKNGLPSSYSVADWTYEQLMQLNLKSGTGGSSATLTPYKIPTLEEAIKVCANRIFIRLDVKGPDGSDLPFWDFERDIWPLMEKYKSYSNIIYTWHSWFKSNSYKLTDTYREKALALSGKAGIVFIGDQNTLSNNNKIIRAHDFNPGIRLFVNFADVNYKTYLKDNKTKLDAYKTKLRTYADVHNGNNESKEFYAELYDAGINYMLVNKALLLCTYIADNFEATPKN